MYIYICKVLTLLIPNFEYLLRISLSDCFPMRHIDSIFYACISLYVSEYAFVSCHQVNMHLYQVYHVSMYPSLFIGRNVRTHK